MKFRSILLDALLVSAFAGCFVSFTATDNDYDPDLALETLSSALDAWKSGNMNVLVSLESPIRFLDDDLLAGSHLVDYEIDQSNQPIRPFQGVPVTLTVKMGNGATVTRPAMYQISLEPSRAVLRSDP